jgi:hypothetical protein
MRWRCPPGQQPAALPDPGAVPLGQGGDELMGVGGHRGGHHLVLGGVRATGEDVVDDGAVK